MPMQDIKLVPGANTQVTKAQNTAGIGTTNLIRIKEGLFQKIGGWSLYYPFQVAATPIRDVHAFQALRLQQRFVGVAALNRLVVISCGLLNDITPQYIDTTPAPNFTTTAGSNLITVHDPGSSASIYGGIRMDTPISVGGLILDGSYPIETVLDQDNYIIQSSVPATVTVSSGGVLPAFYGPSGLATLDAVFPGNHYQAISGAYYPFTAPSSVGGVTVQGPYEIAAVIDSTHFQIRLPTITTAAVSSGSPVYMNGGLAAIHHYVTLGPQPPYAPYGEGLYGAGPYGIGIPPTEGTGNILVADDWILDNWGELLVAFQRNGPVWIWAPDLGMFNAQAIVGNGAPQYSLGGFVAQPQQIMFLWGSCTLTGQQDPLTIRWSDIAAQAGYTEWSVTPESFAGSFHIPTASTIRAGVQGPLYAVFTTDLDVWAAQYIGQPLVYSFMRVGTGCGCIGEHAMDVQSGVVFWAGIDNFYMLGPNGVQVMPCTVWDFFFQQIDTANAAKVRCASNSVFNELTWYFPVIGGNGENSAYVKCHIEGTEYEWDYGYLSRTAWVDVTAVGNPIGADNNGFIYQHETSADGGGTPINAAIETGYFELGDGSNLVFVDWVLPDAKWGQYQSMGSGILIFTFYVTDYAGQAERVYGPFAVTQTVPYINCRMRGRYWRMRVESQDLGSFWRLGLVKFRWGPAGRR